METSVSSSHPRWVAVLLFALVFLSEPVRVDVEGLEGVNRQQHVPNVSLQGEERGFHPREQLSSTTEVHGAAQLSLTCTCSVVGMKKALLYVYMHFDCFIFWLRVQNMNHFFMLMRHIFD